MTATYHITIPQYLSMGLAGALLTWQSAALVEHASAMQGMTTTMLIGIPLVAVTVAALPTLMEEVWRRARWFVALPVTLVGLLPPFALLLTFIVLATVGRSGEVRDARSEEARASSSTVALTIEELTRASQRLALATKEVDRSCKVDVASRDCTGWQRTEKERLARVAELRKDLNQPDPTAGIGADSRRVAALLGVQASAVDQFQPLLMPLGIELALWPLVWIAFTRSLRRKVDVVGKPDLTALAVAQQGDPVLDILRRVGRPVTNDELAERLKVSKGQASKMVTERVNAGLLLRERRGREVDIALTVH